MVFCKRKGTRNAYLPAKKLKFLECVHCVMCPSNVSPLWVSSSCRFWRISILFPRKLRQHQLQVVSFLELPTSITISPKTIHAVKAIKFLFDNSARSWWLDSDSWWLVVIRQWLVAAWQYIAGLDTYVLVKISCKQQFRNCYASLCIKMSLFWIVNHFSEKCKYQVSPKYPA